VTKEEALSVFEDFKIRRVYDEVSEAWLFSVVDVIAALLGQRDYQAARNYWKVLKNRLKKEGSASTAGTHTATATLWDAPNPPVTAPYEVVGSGEWVLVPSNATTAADDPGTFTACSNCSIDCDENVGVDDWYKTKLTLSGGYVWDLIGSSTVSAPDTFTTTACKTWTIGGSVTGEVGFGVPMVGGAKVSVTVSGSFETSLSHALQSGPDAVPYQWLYKHYQKCLGLNHTIETWKLNDYCSNQPAQDDPRWQETSVEGFTITAPQPLAGLQGTTTYLQNKWKKCP